MPKIVYSFYIKIVNSLQTKDLAAKACIPKPIL